MIEHPEEDYEILEDQGQSGYIFETLVLFFMLVSFFLIIIWFPDIVHQVT